MKRQSIDIHADLTAPIEAVWGLLSDVTTWSDWAGFSEATYEQEGRPDPHGTGAVRRLRVGPLKSRERVIAYTPPSHLAYDYSGSLPVRDYRADVTLAPNEEGTKVTWHSEFVPTIPLTGMLLRMLLTRVLRKTLARLGEAAA